MSWKAIGGAFILFGVLSFFILILWQPWNNLPQPEFHIGGSIPPQYEASQVEWWGEYEKYRLIWQGTWAKMTIYYITVENGKIVAIWRRYY